MNEEISRLFKQHKLIWHRRDDVAISQALKCSTTEALVRQEVAQNTRECDSVNCCRFSAGTVSKNISERTLSLTTSFPMADCFYMYRTRRQCRCSVLNQVFSLPSVLPQDTAFLSEHNQYHSRKKERCVIEKSPSCATSQLVRSLCGCNSALHYGLYLLREVLGCCKIDLSFFTETAGEHKLMKCVQLNHVVIHVNNKRHHT